MALPAQIGAGVPLQYLSSPFKIASAWYAVAIFSTGGLRATLRARVYSAADPTGVWTIVDGAHEPAVTAGSGYVALSGTTVWLITGSSTSGGVLCSFSTSSGLWGAAEAVTAFPSVETVAGLIVRSGGDLLALSTNGPRVVKRTGAGVWTTDAQLQTGGSSSVRGALAADDRLRAYYDPGAGALLSRSVDASDTMDAQETLTSAAAFTSSIGVARAALSYSDILGLIRTCALYADNRTSSGNPLLSFARAVDGSNPAFTADIRVSSAPAKLTPARLIVDSVTPGRTDVLYAMWIRASDGALMLNHASSPGDSWTNEQVARAALNPQSVMSWQPAVYVRGPSVVWGFTYQAASGGFFYDEVPLRSSLRGPLRMIL